MRTIFLMLFCSLALGENKKPELVFHGGESHGGNDSPIVLLKEAREPAAKLVESLDLKKLPERTNKQVLAFLEEEDRLSEWAEIIREIDHDWPDSDEEDERRLESRPKHLRTRCATTSTDSDKIEFSTLVCQERITGAESAIRITLHETIHQQGVEDEALTELIVAAVYSQRKITKFVPEKDPLKPQLLFEESFKKGTNGISFADAKRLCAKYKSMYQDLYFLAYCVFHEKNWTEEHEEVRYYDDYRFLGYDITVARSGVGLKGIYAAAQYVNNRPVYKRISVPFNVKITTKHRVFGLRVFGLSKMDSSTPYTTVLSSNNIDGSGILSATFKSAIAAYRACKDAKLEANKKQNFKYYRAECFVEEDKYGKYFYIIKTRNPFVQ